MKAAITPEYGPASIFEFSQVATPTVGDNEILVEVMASPVTAGDRRLRSADFPGVSFVPGRLMMGVMRPRHAVQGSMFAGRVAQVGAQVRRFAVGDNVFGSVDHGAYAEFVKVAEDATVARMPENLSYAEAAEVPYGAVTALHFLRELGGIQQGMRVLIVGASGGVGRYAVQVARHFGADVTAVCSASKAAGVLELGAHRVIDYATTDWTTNGQTYDIIFDVFGASSFSASRRSLTARGRYLTLLVSVGVVLQMLWTSRRDGQQARFGVAMGDQAMMEEIVGIVEQGQIRPVVEHVFEFDRISDAHATADDARTAGGVIVAVGEERIVALRSGDRAA